MSSRILEGPAARFAMQKALAQQRLLESCLQYISCVPWKAEWKVSHETDYPLLNYTSTHWPHHAKKYGYGLSSRAKQLIINTLENPKQWRESFDPQVGSLPSKISDYFFRPLTFGPWNDSRFKMIGSSSTEESPEESNSLYCVACLDLPEIVEYLLNVGSKVNGRGQLFGNALQVASLKNYRRVVRQLLQHGPDLDASGGYLGMHCKQHVLAATLKL